MIAVVGCEPSPLMVEGRDDTATGSPLPSLQPVSAAGRFPAERDLAILFPLEEHPYIQASTQTVSGDPLLPSTWVHTIADAFDDTLAEDAMHNENTYEDWRLVSARIVPCAPVARSPALAPASVCWPIVRLVWQPVVPGVNIWGVELDAYADDRAIHALYPVQPRSRFGDRTDTAARSAVIDHLDRGGRVSELTEATLAAFEQSRDDTTHTLLEDLAALRDPSIPADRWQGISLRPELEGTDAEAEAFISRFIAFLERYTNPTDLREMTAFSLPEGRNPAADDTWVFLQFLSDGAILRRNHLEVYSRNSGDLLLDYGIDQSAGQTTESDLVTAALDTGPEELRATVVESSRDIDEIAELVTDPTRVFVPNTTCATCHRLNDLRFDFHSLSHFEDRDHTISPRVEAEVAHELDWVARWMVDGAPGTLEQTEVPEAETDRSDESPEEADDAPAPAADPATAWEPNESFDTAPLVSTPFTAELAITDDDLDHFTFDWAGGILNAAIRFSHAQGDLDLSVLSTSGDVLASSASISDDEAVEVRLSSGRYVIRVEGYRSATAPYRMQID